LNVNTWIKSALPYLALIAIAVGFFNFFWFFAESAALGGDGLNGYARGGRYYVASHGSYTEVSEAAWTWSRIHAVSVFITHPLAMAGGAYLLLRFVFPSMMAGRTSEPATDDRVQRIRGSGKLLASAGTAGKVGLVNFSGPLLEVSVYPGGVVIKPVFMKPHAILASEIRGVTAKRSILGRRVEIAHTGVDSTSPFVIFGSGDSTLVGAIEYVASLARSSVTDGITTDADTNAPPSSTELTSFASGAPGPNWQAGGVPPGIMGSLGIMGVAVSVVMVGIGLFWAIPNLGPFGVVWTAFAVFIAVSNIRRLLAKR
jgi:hypothetical protein